MHLQYTFRVRWQLGLVLLGAITAASGRAQTAQPRVPVTPDMVATALSRQGLAVSADQLEMPVQLTAAGVPDLQVTKAELIAPQKLRVRLTCAAAAPCQPFLALVRLHSIAAGLHELSQLQATPSTQTAGRTVYSDRLLAGQHVTLLMEDAHMRIRLPVIAIDSGAHGAEVRVASLDRKQNYRGVVEDAGTVRGALP